MRRTWHRRGFGWSQDPTEPGGISKWIRILHAAQYGLTLGGRGRGGNGPASDWRLRRKIKQAKAELEARGWKMAKDNSTKETRPCLGPTCCEFAVAGDWFCEDCRRRCTAARRGGQIESEFVAIDNKQLRLAEAKKTGEFGREDGGQDDADVIGSAAADALGILTLEGAGERDARRAIEHVLRSPRATRPRTAGRIAKAARDVIRSWERSAALTDGAREDGEETQDERSTSNVQRSTSNAPAAAAGENANNGVSSISGIPDQSAKSIADGDDKGVQPMPRKSKDQCAVAGCDRPVLRRGVCGACYQHAMKHPAEFSDRAAAIHAAMAPLTVTPGGAAGRGGQCRVHGCTSPAKWRGVCLRCYQHQARHPGDGDARAVAIREAMLGGEAKARGRRPTLASPAAAGGTRLLGLDATGKPKWVETIGTCPGGEGDPTNTADQAGHDGLAAAIEAAVLGIINVLGLPITLLPLDTPRGGVIFAARSGMAARLTADGRVECCQVQVVSA